MIQLRVNYNEGISDHLFLDLYENDPIRINMSIEDIKDTAPTSTYSQSFRIPETPNNSLFFSTAFSVNGLDFDVTVKHPADLMVDGAVFKKGHIRLMKIYSSYNESLIEYEVAFLGETRDLSSSIGSKMLNELDTTSLVHEVTYENITLSWLAQPDPNDPNGLKEGNIIYPLINFGNTYNDDNIVTDTRISNNGTSLYFTNPSYPLTKNRFKPMVRARWLFEKIFEEAGFTIQSNFFDTELFMKTYVSAFGNDERNIIDTQSNNVFYGTLANDYYANYMIPFSVNEDPGFNYEDVSGLSTFANSFEYRIPVAGDYRVKTALIAKIQADGPLTQAVRFTISRNVLLPEIIFQQIFDYDGVEDLIVFTYDQVVSSLGGPFDSLFVTAEPLNGAEVTIKAGSYFRIPEAESSGISISYLLDNKYKQIDFIKDIMTTFRLVIEPSKTVENGFVIEPWVDYMGSGEIRDWTDKVDDSKDTVIEPIFYDQEEKIKFAFAEDKDWLNKLNEDQFKETFSTLLFDSRNELLKGEREYTTKYAGTPVTQIDNAPIEAAGYANMVIPHIYTKDIEDNLVLNRPIRPKTRVMFWNGMKDNNVDGYTNGSWYMINDSLQSVAQTQYPRVSPYFYFPLTYASPILMWQKENGYVKYQAEVGSSIDRGLSLYDAYWSRYVNLLYDKWSRKITLTMKLNASDLNDFNFKDLVSIKGTYYYVSKISNLTLNDDDFCKVELIKYNPYNLPLPEGLLIWNIWDELWNTTEEVWG